MASSQVECICNARFDAADLVRRYPPKVEDRNKKIVFALTSPPGAIHSGTILFSRWRSTKLREQTVRPATRPTFELREDYFTYDVPAGARVEWHLNFAHSDLFRFYGGPLFAQDEMQVVEHPALASLRHALLDGRVAPLTVEHGIPTPVLVMGVERRCAMATNPDRAQGRPQGLYGNAFAAASPEAIRRATRILEPPTTSNILAMEAPAYGSGPYTRREFELILSTACTGFTAAVQESKNAGSPGAGATVHTGFWGCGAYGGNRVVMALCQMIAAACSEVDALVFHAGTDNAPYSAAASLFADLCPKDMPIDVAALITRIEGMRFKCGVSDGN